MNAVRLGVLTLMILAASAFAQDGAAERKLLEGTWTPAKLEQDGKALDEKLTQLIKLVVKGEAYTVLVGKLEDKGTCKIDPSKKPKTMDLVGTDGPNKGKTILCIYELKDDTLRVCYDLMGKERPTEFNSQNGRFLATYKRAK